MPSTTDRHARNDRIVALAAHGLTQREIAGRVGLTERQIRRVLREREAARRPRPPATAPDAPDLPAVALLDDLEATVGTLVAKVHAYAGPGDRRAALAAAALRLRADHAIAALRARAPTMTREDMSGQDMSGPDAGDRDGEEA